MDSNRKSDLLAYQNKAFDELYIVNTLIQMTKSYCSEREYKGIYYGATKKDKHSLSSERNEYIAMLTLAEDRLSRLMKLCLSAEKEIISLQ